MKRLFLDCFAGISGDMFLGGLVDLGLDQAAWRAGLEGLPVRGWTLSIRTVRKAGIRATKVDVAVQEEQPHRHLSDIRAILADSGLPPSVRERAAAVFEALAEAEARVHGTDKERVHFHEVGAVDAIVDVVGAV
ncbi:MAG TPA: nickel insertion protein, partial [Limnochordia bacterium]